MMEPYELKYLKSFYAKYFIAETQKHCT